MNNKCESAKVSEVEEHISLKYEIKKRLGKGVSAVLSEVTLSKLPFLIICAIL